MVGDDRVIGFVTSKNQPQDGATQTVPNMQSMIGASQRPMLFPGFPMMQQMQTSQMPFPLLFFLFPRIAMLLMMRRNFNSGQGGIGVQNITELVRDSSGRITQIIEMTK